MCEKISSWIKIKFTKGLIKKKKKKISLMITKFSFNKAIDIMVWNIKWYFIIVNDFNNKLSLNFHSI